MSLIKVVLNPLRSLLGASIKIVFEADVRHNPTVINADTQSDDAVSRKNQKEILYGFAPQYVAPVKRPKTDVEAQRLYNHIRTVSWYLDAIPLLGRKLPFNIGVESIIGGIIPGLGDIIGLILSLYIIIMCALFGLPLSILGMMIVNIVLDCIIGIIPVIGDILDVAFKANLRNLRLMEDHLISTKGKCHAGQFRLNFPPSNVFLPKMSPQRQQPMPAVSNRWSGFGKTHSDTRHETIWTNTEESLCSSRRTRRDFL